MDASWRQQRVLDLLDALVAGDRDTVKSYLAPTCSIVFPGFAATGPDGVDELYAVLDVAFDGVPTKSYDTWTLDDSSAVVTGSLFGRFADGLVMDGTRYVDWFRFDADGRITHWLVWNDLAILVASAAPAAAAAAS
ncbi:MAG: nuclear transport factor 2 family protein [Thermoleophilia bacterium]